MITESLAAWSRGAQAVALLSAANESGYLAYLATPRTLDEFAQFAGLPDGTAADLLAALAAHDVISSSDGQFQLTEDTAAAFDGIRDIGAKIEEAALAVRRVAEVTRTGSAPLTDSDALLVAKASALRPSGSPASQAIITKVLDATPEIRDILAAGGRLLDVGSGVSGFVVNALSLLPSMRATTVELVGEVAAVPAAKAKELGIDDRLDVRVMDARDFDEPAAYDAAFWAQPFFSNSTRAAALAMILRSLRPGGLLMVQQIAAEPAESAAHAEFLLRRLVAHAHDVPYARPIDSVAEEVSLAGFEIVRVTVTPFGPIALARRPLPALQGSATR
ncbi:SAM-dependent methyltransferase [Actinoplanes solisilvae]|uniref:SAM-dependent methyltransferase n=1 Tax=Actinoplanes solisilvae TaxID=2486853 RepID=UPI000FDB8D84|nr:class I SAM-dependent methyltransferase [Actinoplanes solisilvae]